MYPAPITIKCSGRDFRSNSEVLVRKSTLIKPGIGVPPAWRPSSGLAVRRDHPVVYPQVVLETRFATDHLPAVLAD